MIIHEFNKNKLSLLNKKMLKIMTQNSRHNTSYSPHSFYINSSRSSNNDKLDNLITIVSIPKKYQQLPNKIHQQKKDKLSKRDKKRQQNRLKQQQQNKCNKINNKSLQKQQKLQIIHDRLKHQLQIKKNYYYHHHKSIAHFLNLLSKLKGQHSHHYINNNTASSSYQIQQPSYHQQTTHKQNHPQQHQNSSPRKKPQYHETIASQPQKSQKHYIKSINSNLLNENKDKQFEQLQLQLLKKKSKTTLTQFNLNIDNNNSKTSRSDTNHGKSQLMGEQHIGNNMEKYQNNIKHRTKYQLKHKSQQEQQHRSSITVTKYSNMLTAKGESIQAIKLSKQKQISPRSPYNKYQQKSSRNSQKMQQQKQISNQQLRNTLLPKLPISKNGFILKSRIKTQNRCSVVNQMKKKFQQILQNKSVIVIHQ